jgi:hypothetical protein
VYRAAAHALSVPVLLSDIFTEALGQALVNTSITFQAVPLLGIAGMAATILSVGTFVTNAVGNASISTGSKLLYYTSADC